VSGGSSTSKATRPQRQLPRTAVTQPSLYITAAFVVAALYELAVALEWIGMPRNSGDDPAGHRMVEALTVLAIVATVAAAFRAPGRAFALVPLAAAAWMVAHYYAFDP
jgi:hypothetical protein